jgi:HSP20 family protein
MFVRKSYNCLPSLVEGFFNHELPISWNQNWASISTPAVNIIEGNNDYRIEVAAPGLSKEDFKINVENEELTVSVNKEVKSEENEDRYTRREFNYTSFCRSFSLPVSVDSEKITATHKEGILTIHVPMKEEAKVKPVREVAIA